MEFPVLLPRPCCGVRARLRQGCKRGSYRKERAQMRTGANPYPAPVPSGCSHHCYMTHFLT